MTYNNRYYCLKGSRAGPKIDAVVVVKLVHRAYTVNAYIIYVYIYLHLYIIIHEWVRVYIWTRVYLYRCTLYFRNQSIWLNTCVYYVYIGTQDNNCYQTVALASAFEETLALPWGACSPQLTTNLFYFFIFKRVAVKRKHTIVIRTRAGTKVAMSDKEIRFFQTRNM